MPGIIHHLAPEAEFIPVGRGQSPERKQIEILATGKDDDQQDREQETRDRIADNDDGAGPDIEARAVPHCLGDTERNADQIGQQRGPETERNGHRQFLDHEVDHLPVAEETFAEIKLGIAAHHQQKPLNRWLVEAIFAFKLLDQFRR